jgi:CRISPR/Cas system-associated exonuclease Cas4 (RecB family)
MGELKNEFSWSKSRAEMFEACPRQYYYHYYGSWGGWDAKADPKARTLYVLKQLMTRQQWLGSTVHNCLRWILTEIREKKVAPPEEKALHALGRRLQLDFRASGEGEYWENPKKARGLLEHEYDDLEVGDDVWSTLFEKALAMVANFYRSDIFQTLQHLAPDDWLEIEKLGSLNVDGVNVWVQIDCAFKACDDIQIVDWKTGKAEAEATRAQLMLYAMYAMNRWAAPAERIKTAEFNLTYGAWAAHRFTAEDFEALRTRITESASAMRALLDDPVQNIASEERFALAPSEKPCRQCPFRRVCPRWAA